MSCPVPEPSRLIATLLPCFLPAPAPHPGNPTAAKRIRASAAAAAESGDARDLSQHDLEELILIFRDNAVDIGDGRSAIDRAAFRRCFARILGPAAAAAARGEGAPPALSASGGGLDTGAALDWLFDVFDTAGNGVVDGEEVRVGKREGAEREKESEREREREREREGEKLTCYSNSATPFSLPGSQFLCGLSLLCNASRGQKLRSTFDLFDYDGDGFISLAEMTRYLASVFRLVASTRPEVFQEMRTTPQSLAEVTASQCFHDADIDHDGQLSFDEFCRWYAKQPSSLAPGGSGGGSGSGGGEAQSSRLVHSAVDLARALPAGGSSAQGQDGASEDCGRDGSSRGGKSGYLASFAY